MTITDEVLLDRFRGPGVCEVCGKRVLRRDPHHLWSRGAGRLDLAINIIALCPAMAGGDNCHHEVHQGKITIGVLIELVAKREHCPPRVLQEAVWALKRAPKGSDADRILRSFGLKGLTSGQAADPGSPDDLHPRGGLPL